MDPNETAPARKLLASTCDECRARKVRCPKSPDSQSCTHCIKRRVPCHFSVNKRRIRQAASNATATTGSTAQAVSPTSKHGSESLTESQEREAPRGVHEQQRHHGQLESQSSKLYIDYLLENRNTRGRRQIEGSILKANDNYVGSSGLAFFSEQRIASITERLGHNRLRENIESLATVIHTRMNRTVNGSNSVISFNRPSSPVQISDESAKLYIKAYFNHVHPVYPFIDRADFEVQALGTCRDQLLKSSTAFSALYHSILALGCQYQDGGTFDPGKGTAWQLYQVSLGLLTDILVPKESLVNMQAIISMAIFAHNSSCLQIGNMLTAEAARIAQLLGFNKATCQEVNEAACHRTFWVIYILEKTMCFACSKASILSDFDIGCPIPEAPVAVFQGFDWFFTMARFSRLISRAYQSLFSISATLNSADVTYANIDRISDELEDWRLSIPESFRPGEPFQMKHFPDHISMTVAVRIRYHYESVIIALSRMTLHVEGESSSPRRSACKTNLMNAARTVIELTRYIDTEAHAPIWFIGSMPLSALFILFDFVVHNPTHLETKSNLSLLGVAAGYFCRLEYSSRGSLPSSLLSNFAGIARQYVDDFEANTKLLTQGGPEMDVDAFSVPPKTGNLVPPQSHNSSFVDCSFAYSDASAMDHPSVESLSYPINNMPLSMVGGLPEHLDIVDFFDNIMVDYRWPVEWEGGQNPGMP
ncbi:fungal-specific transcription factor domain-containing protein [Leptodontidium sp. 2 PMI_412]|nr:fungal-specific transcription factor domain-containing protein [Leptodontidium sp. 2 PMI_412]